MGSEGLRKSIVVLQTPSSGIDARIAALRFIQGYATDNANKGRINSHLRKNINELVLSTVLSIVMSDDRIADLRRRQLIRAECFLILGTLLGSNTLFGNVQEKLDEIEADNTTRLLAEHAAAERGEDQDDLTVDPDAEQYGRDSLSAQRHSVSAGERTSAQALLPVLGSLTPQKRVRLRNPIHEVKHSRTKGPGHQRADGKGSPEVKMSSPIESPRDSPVPSDVLTRMLPPVPDGWVDPDADSPTNSPSNSVTSKKSDNTLETEDTPDEKGHGKQLASPGKFPLSAKPRPKMGPPGGWVREEKQSHSEASHAFRSPAKSAARLWDSPGELARDRSQSPQQGRPRHTMQVGIMSQSMDRLTSDLAYSKSGGLDLSLIRPVVSKQPRKLLKNKKLAPRPSGFLSGAYELDGFAAGVDPTDWFEQDRRLGYQKSRMFFPVPGVGPQLDKNLLPAERKPQGPELKVDSIVQEFLQMRAMLTYVGDIIMLPYTDKQRKITKTQDGLKALAAEGHFGDKSAKPLRRLAGVLDEGRYEAAVEQAMAVWSPLVGANLPRKDEGGRDEAPIYSKKLALGQRDPTQYQAALKLGDKYGETPLERPPWEPLPVKSIQTGLDVVPQAADSEEGADAERAVLITKKVLRSLVRKEAADRQRARTVLSQTMNMLVGNDYISRTAVEERQTAMMQSLNEQQQTLQDELNAIKKLSVETTRVQYATLPKRFLLLIEGKKANPREMLSKMTEKFCRLRSRNKLIIAFGTWKAQLIIAASERAAPIYARTAACYLMKEWATNRKLKQMKKQFQTWATAIAKSIFAARNSSVLPIQTLYRRYRDRCLLLRMHAQGAYDGPLSDIELAPERNLPFKIPAVIRNTRRDIWFGVVKIQSNFRRWSVYRHTLKRRNQVVLLQSVIRMFPIREKFKRLKRHTIRMQAYARRTIARRKWCNLKIQAVIIQKYVRRYLGILWKWRLFRKAWLITEKRMGAAILIQCRWREYRAKKRVFTIKKNRHERNWAALVLQRIWFKQKRAFHTFALMCCLRAAEQEEIAFQAFITWKGRFYAARKIQRVYAQRFFRRNVTAAVKIQCIYRGHNGMNIIEKMRREKWACRRLCHWARGALRRKMKRVRQIQRCWWNYKRGNLLKHLAYVARLQDEKVDKIKKERRYLAACRIQALVLGIWARRWAKRTRAAIKIQKPARMYIARIGWKRQVRLRNRNGVRAYWDKLVATQIKIRVKEIVKMHSEAMIRPQAIARGYITRMAFQAATIAARKYATAVLKIQRCWRSNGAMAQAVAEVMSRRRAATNPFRDCSSIHRLLQMYYQRAEKLYSTRDPRAGMKVSTFLYRLGISSISPMFPPRQFSIVSDLRELDLQTLEEMYAEWMAYEDRKILLQGGKPAKHKHFAPVEHFKYMLAVLKPPLVPRSPVEIAMVQNAQHYTECTNLSPNAAAQDVQVRFIKKFGHSQSSRALNVGEKVKQNWFGYNNYKALGEVFTPGMVTRALEDSAEGASVWHGIQGMMARSDEKQIKQEFEWDKKRVAECVELSQSAIEQARVIILRERAEEYDEDNEHDPIMIILNKAYNRVMSYKRKFNYMRDKLVSDKAVQFAEPAQHGQNGVLFQWTHPESTHAQPLSAFDSVDLPFTGAQVHFDLEMNISILKIYQDAFNRLYTASLGIQGLKTKWFIYTVRRAIRNARLKVFLAKKTEEYMHDRHGDHVTAGWLKFRRADAVARKLALILAEREQYKIIVRDVLNFVPRHGWQERMDDQGYPYYVDTLDRDLDPTYEMPRYEPSHWKAVLAIQRLSRRFLARLREYRRLKEEAKAREMAAIEEKWMEEILKGQNLVKLELTPRTNNIREKLLKLVIEAANAQEATDKEAKRRVEESAWRKANPGQVLPAHLVRPASEPKAMVDVSKAGRVAVDPSLFAEGSEQAVSETKEIAGIDMEVEARIPWRFRFEEAPIISSGMWALLRTDVPEQNATKPSTSNGEAGDQTERTGSGNGTAQGTGRAKSKGKGRGYGKYGKKAVDPNDSALQNPYLVTSGSSVYESVVVFRVRKAPPKKRVAEAPTISGSKTADTTRMDLEDENEMICDTKNYRGIKTIGVSTKRLFLMNIDVGSRVECRYQKSKHFYRGKLPLSTKIICCKRYIVLPTTMGSKNARYCAKCFDRRLTSWVTGSKRVILMSRTRYCTWRENAISEKCEINGKAADWKKRFIHFNLLLKKPIRKTTKSRWSCPKPKPRHRTRHRKSQRSCRRIE